MSWITVSLSAGTMLTMAIVLTAVLGWANRKFYVDIDDSVLAVIQQLPGADCGNCGYVGCGEYAEVVVFEQESVNKCTVGGQNCAVAVAGIMGVAFTESLSYRPIVHFGAHTNDRLDRNEYRGENRCSAAHLVANVQGCTYGCLGFDTLHVNDGLATVDYDKCVGCGACAKACPRNIITVTPFKAEQMLAETCSNKDKGKDVVAVCNVGCIGCAGHA